MKAPILWANWGTSQQVHGFLCHTLKYSASSSGGFRSSSSNRISSFVISAQYGSTDAQNLKWRIMNSRTWIEEQIGKRQEMWEVLRGAVVADLLGASFLGVRGMSCGSSVNSYSWTLGCRFLDLGLPGPGPGPWLPLPSNFCFFGLWREEAAGSGSFPSFRKRLSPFLSCQSVRI